MKPFINIQSSSYIILVIENRSSIDSVMLIDATRVVPGSAFVSNFLMRYLCAHTYIV